MSEVTQKQWSQIKGENSWTLFKVIAEFVDGFERLDKFGPCISIFGSARAKEGSHFYELTVEIAHKLVEAGFGVISGGGPGIMEAANKGAKSNNGLSVGLNIYLPFEKFHNKYIDQDKFDPSQILFCKESNVCEICSRFCGPTGRIWHNG
jgi:hypothetical protein